MTIQHPFLPGQGHGETQSPDCLIFSPPEDSLWPFHAYTHNAPGLQAGFVLPGPLMPSSSTKAIQLLILFKIGNAQQPLPVMTCKALINQVFL